MAYTKRYSEFGSISEQLEPYKGPCPFEPYREEKGKASPKRKSTTPSKPLKTPEKQIQRNDKERKAPGAPLKKKRGDQPRKRPTSPIPISPSMLEPPKKSSEPQKPKKTTRKRKEEPTPDTTEPVKEPVKKRNREVQKPKVNEKRKSKDKKSVLPSPIWGSFDQDTKGDWPRFVKQVICPGQADNNGRISNFIKVISVKVPTNVRESYHKSMANEAKKIDETGLKKHTDEKLVVTYVEKKKPLSQSDYAYMLTCKTTCGYYMQQLFEGNPKCISVAGLWIPPTSSAKDILKAPHKNDKGQLTRYYNGSQLMVVASLRRHVLLHATSDFDSDSKVHEILLHPGLVAVFSKDITVKVVGKIGQTVIPASSDGKRKEMDNSHQKCLFIAYMHVMPKPIEGLKVTKKQSSSNNNKKRKKPQDQS